MTMITMTMYEVTSRCFILLATFLLGFLAGKLYFRDKGKPEVLFFPDSKLPCNSFYKKLEGRNFVCPRVNCQFAHIEQERTSLMRVFMFLNEAKESIDLCIFDFTLTVLADFLIGLRNKGIKVRIITDAHADRKQKPDDASQPSGGDYRQFTNDQIPKLQSTGIPIKINKNQGDALMHNKFALVDNNNLIMGSFNWTRRAVLKNHEAIIKTSDPRIVRQFVNKFNEIWRATKKRPTN